ncbi:MAG: arginine--tRNA ligase [Chloroflexi bacterium]|nr:MAG: arginine--tRNA ligase [Chloroflexota bacterium]
MIRSQLQTIVQSSLADAQSAGVLPAFDLPTVDVTRPKQAEHGDYSTNVAMVAAAAVRKAGGNANPRQIAQAVVDHLPANDLIGLAELAGPGFINFRLADSWLQEQVGVILEAGETFGNLDRGRGERWQVEFVSANPTGPIHYGGARNAVLGDSVANVLAAAGYQVQREFYVNDRGTQFEAFIATLYARYTQKLGRDEPVPENGYLGEYMFDYAQEVIDEYGDRFLHMDKSMALQEMRAIGYNLVVQGWEHELARIGVHFDRWFSEQSLYDEGLVEQALDYLDQRGELVRREGAVWFTASRYPNIDKDVVVVRSNGAPSYFASDIAYHYDKFVRRQFDHVVNVWAVDHQGHVPRMKAMMQAFGLDPERLTILMYDLVKLVRDGQEVKLSKRMGNLLTINEVVDEVGSDALRFNLLTRSPESTIEFDLDLATQQTNENPVYYVQYSHARICSIYNRAVEEGLVNAQWSMVDGQWSLLTHSSELALIRKLLELEEQIELAVEKLSPHNLTHYALELARTFNAFYRDCRVVDPAEPDLSQARLGLAQAARIALAKTLRLMGVSAPESM